MSWVKSKRRAQAFIGRRVLAWCGCDGDIRISAVDSVDAALDLLLTSCSEHGVTSLKVWLSGAVCQLERLSAIAGVRSKPEAEEACTAAVTARANAVLAAPPIVRLPYWPYEGSLWCAAVMDAEVLLRIESIQEVRVESIKPWWSWALPHFRESQGTLSDPLALAMFDGESVVVCNWDGEERLAGAATAAPVSDAAIANRFVARRAASNGLASVGRSAAVSLSFGSPAPVRAEDLKATFGFDALVRVSDVF